MCRCVVRDVKHCLTSVVEGAGGWTVTRVWCAVYNQLHRTRERSITDCWEKPCRSDKAKRLVFFTPAPNLKIRIHIQYISLSSQSSPVRQVLCPFNRWK